MLKKIEEYIEIYKDEKYKEFHSSLIRTKYKVNGIRIPILRKFAKEIIKNNQLEELLKLDNLNYEIVMLKGLCIAYCKKSLNEKWQDVEYYANLCDDWSLVDIVACTIKSKEYFLYNKALELLKKDKEFVIRFGIVLLKTNFVDSIHLEEIIEKLSDITSDAYYVEMAIAWLLQEISVKDKMLVMSALNEYKFGLSIINKTKQKIRESLRK